MGKVFIRDLVMRGIIGIHPHERESPQEIVVNIEIEADLTRAGQSDDIADCVDYQRVVEAVTAHATSAARLTVEALATDLARICVSQPGVDAVRVRVEKPAAIASCRSVGVEVILTRASGE
ncbi:MAG: dihydroneopterin aldolase [Isosphaeraceae bacterium]